MRADVRRALRIGLVLAAFVAVIAYFTLRNGSKAAHPTISAPIAVVTANAKSGDQPIYLTGLGSVVGYKTVTVRTRVDGELVRVAVREGQMVSSGDLIAEIDPRPFQVQLEQAEAQKDRDVALLENAKVDAERYRILYSQDSIPKQQLDTQIALVRQNEATVRADQAAIDNAKLQLIYTRITSPINGRIGLRQVDPGNMVHATDQGGLAVITQLQPIAVIFSIPQDNVPQVMKQLRAGRRMLVEAWDRDLKNKISTGSLLTIDNQADVATGTVRFKATFANNDNALFPNQFVNARLLVDVKRKAVLVPVAAVQHGPDTTFVFVVNEDDTVQTRNVVAGTIEAGVASIDRGLSPGETVVTEGVDKLQHGAKVQPTPGE
ncbi:MAG TPA: MdtA/MuxA family multidrug efflux RND transporter periplasmic adaptor subunit [Terriglobia bacterium]|nr:MdtA/MuxA family multidrug efflux RND transporter periplasmic adaptor subunit [Terriglobia bacterium]